MAYKSMQPATAPGPESEDYFSDGPETTGEKRMGGDEKGDQENEGKEEEGETAIAPKSVFEGYQPGDRCTVEIVRSHDDNVEFKVVGEDHEPEAPEPGETAPKGGAQSDMEDLMS